MNRLKECFRDDISYACVMFPCESGVFPINGVPFDVVWRNMPENPDNGIKSRIVAHCIGTGEKTVSEFKAYPTRVVGIYSGYEYFEDSPHDLRPLVYTRSFILSE